MPSGSLSLHDHPSLIPLIPENHPFPAWSLLSFRDCSFIFFHYGSIPVKCSCKRYHITKFIRQYIFQQSAGWTIIGPYLSSFLFPSSQALPGDFVLLIQGINGSSIPVSYTHLDVYKRQTWERPQGVRWILYIPLCFLLIPLPAPRR